MILLYPESLIRPDNKFPYLSLVIRALGRFRSLTILHKNYVVRLDLPFAQLPYLSYKKNNGGGVVAKLASKPKIKNNELDLPPYME